MGHFRPEVQALHKSASSREIESLAHEMTEECRRHHTWIVDPHIDTKGPLLNRIRQSILLGFLIVATLAGFAQSTFANNRKVVYQGRVLRPDGSPLEGVFKVQIKIYSPDPKRCLLWGEEKDVSFEKGAFSVEAGDASKRLVGANAGGSSTFTSVFLNEGSLALTGLNCDDGTTYTPTATDDRIMTVTLFDGGNTVRTFDGPIKAVPFAIQATNSEMIGGYTAPYLLKVNPVGAHEPTRSFSTLGFSILYSLAELPQADFGGKLLKGVLDPVDPQDVATKNYVDQQLSTSLGTLGSVKRVDTLSASSGILNVTGGPITDQGTISVGFADQGLGVLAAPTGTTGQPVFRQLIDQDIANVSAAKITGTLGVSNGGLGNGTFNNGELPLYNAMASRFEGKACTPGQVLVWTVSNGWDCELKTSGSVTSVDLSMPSTIFNVIGGPITSAGSFEVSFQPQSVGLVFAAPTGPTGSTGTPLFRQLEASDIPDLDASKITSGTLDYLVIPDLDASKITTGTFDVARIPNLDAAKITSGTFDVLRIPDLDASKIVSGTLATQRGGTGLDGSLASTGQLLIGTGTGGFALGNLIGGPGVSIANQSGSITISTSGGTLGWVQGGNAFGVAGTLGTNDNTPFYLRTNASNRMVVTSGGSFGFGTLSPNAFFDINGLTAISGGLNVVGATALTGSLSVGGPAAITGALTVGGNTSLAGTLGVGGSAAISGPLSVGGNTAISGQLTVDGRVVIGGSGAVTGALVTYNGVGAANSSVVLPRDTSANRPAAGVPGMIRYNTDLLRYEVYQEGQWMNVQTSTGTVSGSVTNVGLTAPSSVFNVTGGPITGAGTFQITLGTQGIAQVFAAPTGASGAPAFRNLAASDIYSGILPVQRGGIGLDGSAATTGQLLIGNGTGGFALGSLVGGPGVTVANQSGSITISTSGGTLGWLQGGNVFGVSGTLGTNDNMPFYLRTNATNRMVVTSGGSFGFGTLSPTAFFDINGNTSIAGNTAISGQLTVDGRVVIGGSGAVTGALVTYNGVGAANSSVVLPRDSSANRPATGVPGMLRYNTDLLRYEVYQDGQWMNIQTSTGTVSGSVTNVGLAAPTSVFNVTGGPITGAGTFQITLGTQGIAQVFAAPTGASGAPAFRNLAASDIYSGILPVQRGGIGLDGSAATTGQLLIGNGTGGFALGSLVGGPGVTVANQSGSITISTSGGTLGWLQGGNSFGQAGTLGTNDNMPFYLRTNATDRMVVTSGGSFGFGTLSPTAFFDINGNTSINGVTAISGGLNVVGPTALTGALTVGGNASVSGNTAISGQLTVDGRVVIGGSGAVTGALVTYNGVGTAHSSVVLPRDSSANRPATGVPGMLRYNTDLLRYEVYQDGQWMNIQTSTGTVSGSVTNVGLVAPSSVFNVTGGPITGAGTFQITLGTQGIAQVFAAPTGASGTPSFRNLAASDIYTGILPVQRGGIGLDGSAATTGQLLIGNGTGGFALGSLLGGPGVTIANQSGSITISTTGGTLGWLQGGNSFGQAGTLGTNDNMPFYLRTNATDRMVVTSGGSFGFGTLSPTAFFDINGLTAISGGLNVVGATALTGSLSVGGPAAITGALNVGGNTSIAGTLGVGGSAAISGQLTVDGRVVIGGSGAVTGALVTYNGVGAANSTVVLPRDSSANRPATGVPGMLRYNTDLLRYEVYQDGQWMNIQTSTGTVSGSVTNVGLVAPTSVFNVTGGPITSAGTFQITLGTQGIAQVFAAPTGASGAPAFRNLAASDIYSGILPVQRGGIGLDGSAATTGQLLIGNGTGGFALGSLVGGPGVSIANQSGSITISTTSGTLGWLQGGNTFGQTGTLGTRDAQDLYLTTNNVPRFAIAASGNIGMGLTLPTSALHIQHNRGQDEILQFTNLAPGFGSFINMIGLSDYVGIQFSGANNWWKVGQNGTPSFVISDETNSRIPFALMPNAPTNSFFMAASGNIGFGTTAPSGILHLFGTTATNSALVLPVASSAVRPTGVPGMIRYNSDVGRYEVYQDGAWTNIQTSTGTVSGSVTNVGLAAPTSVFNVTGGPITGAGTFQITLGTQGIAQVFAAPTGASGAPSFRNLAASDIYTGILPVQRGGIGLDGSAATTGQLLIGNGTGGFALGSLLGGPGVTIANQSGSITISTTGGTLGWLQGGNTFGQAGTLGTNDNMPFYLRTNSVNRMVVTSGGSFGFGKLVPNVFFDIEGATAISGQLSVVGATALSGSLTVGGNTAVTGALITMNGTGSLNSSVVLPRDNTANRPATGVPGMIRYNTDLGRYEVYQDGAWTNIQTSTGTVSGSVTNVGLAAPTSVFNVTGGPITGAGTFQITLGTQGIAQVFAAPTGASGAPSFRNLAASDIYTGILPVQRGGIGLDGSAATTGQLLIGNGTGGFALGSLIGGPGVTVANQSGSITISTTGGTLGWLQGGNSFGQTGTFGTNDAQPLAIRTAGTTRMMINTGGSVGIGTATPFARLHVAGDLMTHELATIIDPNGTLNLSNITSSLRFKDHVGVDVGGIGYLGTRDMFINNIDSAGGLRLQTNNTERMYIANGGQVRIGTGGVANTAILDLQGYGNQSAFIVPRDTQANRPATATTGMIRFNTTVGRYEVYQNSQWENIQTSTGTVSGSVTNVGLVAPTSVFNVTGGPITAAGTFQITLGTQGIAQVFAAPTGASGAPAFRNLAASDIYSGILPVQRGGIGLDGSAATTGQLLIGNGTGGFALGSLVGGPGVTVANQSGSITISTTGGTLGWLQGGNSFGQAGTLGTNDAQPLAIRTAGSTRVNIGTTGFVGIGALSPIAQLHVNTGTLASEMYFTNTASGQTLNDGLNIGVAGDNSFAFINNREATDLVLQVNNIPQLYLRSTGMVQVGTGAIAGGAILELNGRGTQSSLLLPRDSSANRPATGISGMIRYNTTIGRYEVFQDSVWQNIQTSTGTASGSVTNVGLVAPSSIFTVTGGPITDAGTFNISLGTQGVSTVFAAPTGASGVPSFRRLAIADLSDGTLAFQQGGNAFAQTGTLGTTDYQDLRFITGGTGRMTLNRDGRLGLGIAPSTVSDIMLNVAGGINIGTAVNFVEGTTFIAGASDSITMRVNNSGIPSIYAGTGNRVGIGTNAPAGRLHVDGGEIIAGAISAATGGLVQFREASGNGTDSVSLRAPTNLAGNVTLTLPATTGATGQFLSTDASGNLSWATNPGGTLGWVQGGNAFGVTGTLGTNDAQALAIRTNGTARINITSGGSVGIGTATPSSFFHVAGPADAQLRLSSSATGNASPGIELVGRTAGADTNAARMYVGWAGDLYLQPGATQPLLLQDHTGAARILIGSAGDVQMNGIYAATGATGNVGIGTSAPSGRLHIDGGAIIAGPQGTGAGNAGRLELRELAANGTNGVSLRAADNMAANYTMTLPASTGTAGQFLSTDASGNLSWATNPGGTLGWVQGGNAFGVTGTLGTNDAQALAIRTNGTARINITSGGSVGFGVTAPSAAIHLVASQAESMRIESTNNDSSLTFKAAATSGVLPKIGANAGDFYINANNVDVMRVNPTGKIDFTGYAVFTGNSGGTDFDIRNLNVNGLSAISVFDSGNTERLTFGYANSGYSGTVAGKSFLTAGSGIEFIIANNGVGDIANFKANGNVGIGTSAPSGRLHVAGGAIIAGPQAAGAGNSGRLELRELAANGTNGVSLRAADNMAANYTLTLPASTGTAGQFLSTDASGNLSWATNPGGTLGWVQGGNSFGVTGTLGTNDAQSLSIRTGGTERILINAGGSIGIGTATPGYLLDVQTTNGNTAAGTTYQFYNSITANPASNSSHSFRGMRNRILTSGASNISSAYGGMGYIDHSGSGILNWGFGQTGGVANNGGGSMAIAAGIYGSSENANGQVNNLLAGYFQAINSSTQVSSGAGVQASVTNSGSGSIDFAHGVLLAINNSGGGVIGNAYGVRIDLDNSSGTVNNYYGIRIADEGDSASRYAVYTDGATRSYFGGNVGIGVLAPSGKLHVEGGPIVAGPVAAGAGNSGQIQLRELTANGTNRVSLRAADNMAANYTLTLPASTGTAGQFLSTDASGNLSWATNPGGTLGWVQGGNTFGQMGTLGTSDNYGLVFKTNDSPRGGFTNTGSFYIGSVGASVPFYVSKSGFQQAQFESTNDDTEIDVLAFGTGKQSMIFLSAARGTKLAPTYLQSGDTAGYISGSPSQGGAQGARISFNAAGNWSAGSTPGDLAFMTSPSGATVPLQRMLIGSDGYIGMGSPSNLAVVNITGEIFANPVGTAAGNAGRLSMRELSANGTNSVSLRAPDNMAANYTLTLPASTGANGQILSTDASGNLSWVTNSGGTLNWAQGGNAFGVTGTLGTNDNQNLVLKTNNNARQTITNSGSMWFGATTQKFSETYRFETNQNMTTDGWKSNVMVTTSISPASTSLAEYIGVHSRPELNTTQTIDRAIAFLGNPSYGATSGPVDVVIGFLGHSQTNTNVTDLNLFESAADINGGTVSNYRGLYVGTPQITSGAITNSHALFIDDMVGTNQFGIYQFGANDRNYFGGSIGIGTLNPAGRLHVDGGKIIAGPVSTGAGNSGSIELRELAANGTNGVSLRAADTMAANYTLTLPAATGTNGQILSTDASGNLSWVTNSGGTLNWAQGGNAFGVTGTLGTNDANPLLIRTNGTTRIAVTAGGSIGIGTTTPYSDLYIRTALPVMTLASSTTAQGNNISAALMFKDNSNMDVASVGFGNTRYLGIYNNDTSFGVSIGAGTVTQALNVQPNGNVSIGNTSPASRLHVEGGAIIAGPQGTGAGNAGRLELRELAANGTNGVSLRAADTMAANYTLTLPAATGTSGQLLSTDSSGNLSWVTNSGGTLAWSQGGNSYGVTGNFGTNDAQALAIRTAGSTRIYINSGGSIGVGTTAPSGALHLFDTGTMVNGEYQTGVIMQANQFTWPATVAQNASSDLVISNGNAPRFMVSANGNIGIGAGTPVVALDIGSTGTGTASAIRVPRDNTTNRPTGSAAVLQGMLRYNTTLSKFEVYEGVTGWTPLVTGSVAVSSLWAQGGNSFGTTGTIGTNDAQALSVRTAGTTRINIAANGRMQIGPLAPTAAETYVLSSTRTDVPTGWSQTFKNSAQFTPTAAAGSAQYIGTYHEAYNSNNQNVQQIIATVHDVTKQGTGTVGQIIGAVAVPFVQNGAVNGAIGFSTYPELLGGTTQEYVGFLVGGGTNTTGLVASIGLKIEDMVSSGPQYGIYQIGANDRNYLNGTVGIGTLAPSGKLHVEGGEIIAGPVSTGAGNSGRLQLRELAANGTNAVSIRAADAMASNYTLTLPASTGTAGQVLSTDASGNLSWATATGGTLNWSQGGNTFGATGTLGTNDAQALTFKTNNAEAMRITSAGAVGVGTNNPATRLHVQAANENTELRVENTTASGGGKYPGVVVRNHQNGQGAGHPVFNLDNANGTQASPSRLTIGQTIGSHSYNAWTSAGTWSNSAELVVLAAANHTSTSAPGSMIFRTTAPGSLSGTDNMKLDELGRLGIGTMTPNQNLQVVGRGSSSSSFVQVGLNGTTPTGWAGLWINTRDGATDLGIGTARGWAIEAPGSSHPTSSVQNDLNITFWNGTTWQQRVVIDSVTGNMGLGLANVNPAATLDVAGDIIYTGTITDVSDWRLKENITPLKDGLRVIRQLPVYSYTMKDDPDKKVEFGLIAQKVQEIVPQLVRRIKNDSDYLGVNYVGLIPWSLKAIQELDQEVTVVKQDVHALKTENEDLKARMDRLEQQNRELAEQVKLLIEMQKRKPAGQ